jgi:Immunoglobulin I-set domain/Ig-like domain CHU_C associated
MKSMGRGHIVTAGALVALLAGHASAQNTTCGGPGLVNAPDLAVGVLTGPSNYTAAGGLDALSIGTTSCNMGNQNVQWNACNSVTHPVIGGNLYRWSTVNGATRFEQVGLSWLKHAFTALTNSDCCSCNGQGGSVLGVGCSDPYTSGRNGSQTGLGPRGQVNAFTGSYTSATCSQHPSGGNTGRLEVLLGDLVNTSGGSAATTRYFGESQYINHDDAIWSDVNHRAGWLSTNNASYIEVTVSGTSTEHNFAFLGSTVRFKSAIQAWKLIDPSVTESTVDVPNEGRFIVCSKATSIGGGVYHYEYSVYNMNSDRAGGSFSVPVDASITPTNMGFHGVIYRGGDGVAFGTNYDGTDWPSTRSGSNLSWATTPFVTNANANAIRWGTTYSFRFDAAAAPVTGVVTLGLFKSGSPATVDAGAQVPGVPVPPPAPPTNLGATPNPVCDSTVTTLSGTVPAGQTIDWFTGSCGGTAVGSGTSLLVAPPLGSTTYYARARITASGVVGTSCSSLVVNRGTSPGFSQQPADSAVVVGDSASFHVVATGGPTFQWRHGGNNLSDGGAYSGVMTDTLTINPTQQSDSGSYDVVVTNLCGNATSNAASLRVCGSPDFNHDGDIGTDADIEAFFACLGGNCCATCDSADFNSDGDIGTDADIEAFFRLLGGGAC